MHCIFCNKPVKNLNSKTQHEIRCKLNENNIVNNYWTPERRKLRAQQVSEHRKIHTYRKPVFTEAGKKKMQLRNSEHNKTFWTKENRERHSQIMSKVVLGKPR